MTTTLETRLFKKATKTWFVIAFVGQAIFAIYIILLYGKNGVMGNWAEWNSTGSKGLITGDLRGNIIFGAHVALAAIVTIGGPLQLISAVRHRFPNFHRINGRIYVLSGILISLAGLYLTWIRGSVGGMIGNIFITVNATVILTSIYFTLYHVRLHNITQHSQWAVRLFLGMSGVWLFRVILMFWIGINQGPVGFDPELFQGPALTAIYFISYVLPLLLLECYYYVQRSRNAMHKYLAIAFLIVLSLCTAIGIAVATVGMWWPRI